MLIRINYTKGATKKGARGAWASLIRSKVGPKGAKWDLFGL